MPATTIENLNGGYRGVLDTIFCSILVFDNDGRLIHYNAAAQAFFSI